MHIYRTTRLVVIFAVAIGVAAMWTITAVRAAPPPSPSARAGYSVSTPSGKATADARLTVPKLTCPSLQSFGAALAGPVMITSNGNSGAFVALICANGVPSYIADIQINGVSTTFADSVNPGDVLALRISESPQSTNVTVTSVTGGWTHSLSGGGGTVSTAFIGTSVANCISGGACSPLDQMTNTRFRIARINGQPIGARALHATATNIVSTTGMLEAKTGGLSLTKEAFTVRWVASCQPDPATNRC